MSNFIGDCDLYGGGGGGSSSGGTTLIASGTAVSGSYGILADNTKDFETNSLIGKFIKITKDGVDYYRKITNNALGLISFDDLVPITNAATSIGTGEDAEGQVVLGCKGILGGAVGDDVTVVIQHGDTDTGETHAAYDSDTKVLSFTVDTNALSEQRTLAVGDVSNILTADALDSLFEVIGEFVAGNLPIGGDAFEFSGGDDGVYVEADDAYEILNASSTYYSISDNDEVLTVSSTAVGLTPAEYNGYTIAYVSVETAAVRYWTSGSTPTSTTGMLLNAGDGVLLQTAEEIANVKFIAVSGDATLMVSYGG